MTDKHKKKLMHTVTDGVTDMFEKILDYTEVAVPDFNQYKKLRSKILRIGNNCIRDLHKEINNRYEVKYQPQSETIIEIIHNR